VRLCGLGKTVASSRGYDVLAELSTLGIRLIERHDHYSFFVTHSRVVYVIASLLLRLETPHSHSITADILDNIRHCLILGKTTYFVVICSISCVRDSSKLHCHIVLGL
jgi:hypothetical protein